MKSPPKVKKTRIAMKSPPKVSKSVTTGVGRSEEDKAWYRKGRPFSEEYKKWVTEMAARERASCELIAREALVRWGPEWTFTWYNVQQLLKLIFEVAIDQMRETQEPFNLGGLVLLKKVNDGQKIPPNMVILPAGWKEAKIRVIPLKLLQYMVRSLELPRSGEVSA